MAKEAQVDAQEAVSVNGTQVVDNNAEAAVVEESSSDTATVSKTEQTNSSSNLSQRLAREVKVLVLCAGGGTSEQLAMP